MMRSLVQRRVHDNVDISSVAKKKKKKDLLIHGSQQG